MMRRLIAAVAFLALAAFSAPAVAAVDSHGDGVAAHNPFGLGFHNVEAPIGMRWWFPGQKIGLDLGFGFDTDEAEFLGEEESVTDWAIEVGVPFVIRSWPRFHALLRPGLLYESDGFFIGDPGPPVILDTDADKFLTVLLELEAEVFLADNFSVSASHGIGFINEDPAGGDGETRFGTTGNNFTNIGFHMYLFGPDR